MAIGFTDRFHRGRQRGIGPRKFFERESRDLHHTIVDGRFEQGRRLLSDIMGFHQACIRRQLCSHLGDWKSRCFGGKAEERETGGSFR